MKLSGLLRLSFLAAIFLLIYPINSNAQIGVKVPSPPKVVSLFEPEVFGLECIPIDSTLFTKKTALSVRSVTMDSSVQFISISESVDQTEFFLPAVIDLETYIDLRIKFDTRELWKQTIVNSFKGKVEESFGAIKLDIPFRIRSKTFTRIFGSDRISLRVTGNISFDLSGRTEERSGSAVSAVENRNTFSPRFRQTQQFTVEGKIGDKVTVSVDQNSEAVTEIENTLKLRYDGDEDEIIQKIEAGNISLSLPSTKYVIFGGSNQGLFGLKAQMKIGNFHFTTIASLEKGQQQELTISGGATKETSTVKDYDFIKNQYFFIDKIYHDHFEEGTKDDPLIFTVLPGDKDILKLDVFISSRLGEANARQGIAVLDPTKYEGANPDTISLEDGKAEKFNFERLEVDKDYTYDKWRGFFKLNQAVDNNFVLAIAYATSGGEKVGTLYEEQADDSVSVILKLIKPRSMYPTEAYKDTWPLMMRNVYSLGGSDIEKEGFDIRLEKNVTGQHETHQDVEPANSFLNLTGLDIIDENEGMIEGGDEKIDKNDLIVNRKEGILIFPSLQPFNPEPGSRFYDKLAAKNRVNIYNIIGTDRTALADSSKFDMIVTSKSTKSAFNLGFYVLEGSEVVTLGGRTLTRDQDYLIDYFSGTLTLLSNEAKRSSSNLQIKYERASLFQLDKKSIFGGRMEYRFWDNSFVGLTALYMNKSTLDQRVRVGQEPFRNFVWDINTALKFKPRFLTRMIDALPFVETNVESSVNIEAEFAQVLPNPNTLNNEKTGDNNGVAYIDDFEASKRSTPLGIRYRTWTMASPPAVLHAVSADTAIVDTMVNKSRAHIAWFNPYHQTPITDIWPDRDVNAQTGQTTDVLGVDFWREKGSSQDSAWAGFMRSTTSFANQKKTKYIELWIKGSDGKVNIDIGRISEDWYLKGEISPGKPSRGHLNTEDRISINQILDEGEDTGIDGIPNDDTPSGDPYYDNWNEPKQNALDVYDGIKYDGINGTEGNSQSREARYPDTEDLDGDDQLSVSNHYFEYSFSLTDSAEGNYKDWIVGETEAGWRQFRIPLKDYTLKVGSPDTAFQQIFFTRIWFSELPEERARIKIATFDFVGNEWEETGVAENDTSKFVKIDSVFKLATYNTEENSKVTSPDQEPYESPPDVSGVVDRITKARSKEQSLAMCFKGLKPGAVAEAKKTLFNTVNIINYKRLRMFVHGDKKLPLSPDDADSSKIRFYLRFGSDDKNYYEYGQKIYAGWNTKNNNIDIDLDKLTKVIFIESKYDTLCRDKDAYYKAVGSPLLKVIRYFTIGVENLDDFEFTGEVWLDEMRLSDVRKESATALRLSTAIKLADLLTFNAQWESKDADFHNISTQFGKGSTTERQSYSGKLTLDKLLPDSWDISVPIDARASFNRSIPKYIPKSDALTGYKNDTIEKKIKSLFGLRGLPKELEDQISNSEVMGIGTTIKKRSKSKRWYIRYTLDELFFDFDYSYKNSSSWEKKYSKSEQYKESFKYKIPFGKDNYFMPFKFAAKIPLLKKLSDQKLYYAPGSINMALNISDVETKSLNRNTGTVINKVMRQANTSTTRSVNAGYKMLRSLNFSYSRSYSADADIIGLKHEDLFREILTKGNFGLDYNISQSFKGDWKPNIPIKWLKTDFSYSNSFNYTLNLSNKHKKSSSKTTKRMGLTFNPATLLKSIYTPKGEKKSTKTRGRYSNRGKKDQDKKDQDEKDEDKQEEGKQEKKKKQTVAVPNPLIILYNIFSTWQTIKTNFTLNERVDNNYLSEMPKWDYQLGFTKNPGVLQDTSLTVILTGPVHSKSSNITTSTGINIMKNVKVSLSHAFSETESSSNYGKNRSGSSSSSYLAMGDNPKDDFKNLGSDWRSFVPDWSVKISGVEKALFFSQFAQSITVDHAHSGKYSENRQLQLDGTFIPTSQSFSNNWQPLLGVNIRTKWGISGNIRKTGNTSFSFSSGGGASKSESQSFTITMSYSKTTGFRIPIPIWPFKGKTYKNEINFNLTYDSSENTTYQMQFNQKKFEEKMKNSSWKLRPSATYRFSKRVQGGMFYEMGATENKISGKYSYSEFGINVNIAIRD